MFGTRTLGLFLRLKMTSLEDDLNGDLAEIAGNLQSMLCNISRTKPNQVNTKCITLAMPTSKCLTSHHLCRHRVWHNNGTETQHTFDKCKIGEKHKKWHVELGEGPTK